MLAVGYAGGKMMGWGEMDSIFLGGILSISSTTIIIRAFEELGVKNKKFASVVFGVLIVEDLVAILLLVLLSVILTSCNVYGILANWGGAGALVPITGFANGVCASAVEFQKEGQVFGIGCQIFKIAGPVILYGIFSSWVLGLIYWLF